MSGPTISSKEFFVAGGTLRHDAESYVPRPADQQLHHLVRSGALCYVLTTRQMGKSSLMTRLGRQLQTEGIATALIDLTTIGTANLEEWYLSLLDDLQLQLNLTTDAESWWEDQPALSPVKRFTKFVRDVVLNEVEGQVAIFIDEIESALNLEFSDDFFAAIRAIYNQTVSTEDAGRLSFILLGVATPNELIKSQHRTPFNVGERIELGELDLEESVTVFSQGLPGQEPEIVERVYHWASGHPYLMQRICQAIARDKRPSWTAQDIDDLVANLFFTERSLVEESNLQFVNGRLTTSPQKEALLSSYHKIYQDKQVQNDERNPIHTELKLYGLVKVRPDGTLAVRNNIYRQVFDPVWIKQHQAPTWKRYGWLALILVTVLSVAVSLILIRQNQRSSDLLAETYIANFNSTENPTLRLDNLAQLIALEEFEAEAVDLFNGLTTAEKIALFTNSTPDLQPQTETVVEAMYLTLDEESLTDEAASSQILEAMLSALQSFDRLDNPALLPEIENWLIGRTAVLDNEYEDARLAYSVALSLNGDNPATRYERALVELQLADNEAALSDLTTLLNGDDKWQNRVRDIVRRNPALHELILADDERYEAVVAYVPTALPVPTIPQSADESPVAQNPTSGPTPTHSPNPPPTSSAEPLPPIGIPTVDAATPGSTAVFIDTPILPLPPSTPDGLIVYTCFIDNIDQICTINPDGSGSRQLTFEGATSWTAVLSVDLRSILFSSSRSFQFTLYEMTTGGENIRAISTPLQGDYSPDISPDGQQVLFTRAEGGDQNVWLMNRDGSNARPLTSIEGDAINASWSPNGLQIVYTQRLVTDTEYTLFIMNADGSDARRLNIPLAGIGGRADWSPDGQWLAFYAGPSNDNDLYIAAADGSAYYRVTDGGDNLAPSFSPDGEWLVFNSSRDGDNDLYLIRRDGTFLTPLTLNDTADWQPNWGK